MNTITGAINVALNGFEAQVTSKSEAKALILANVEQVLAALAEEIPIALLDRYSERFGLGFAVCDGRIDHIVFG